MIKLLFAALLVISSLLNAQVSDISGTASRIETYLNQLEEAGFSGTVLVELDNQKVISKGYGFSNRELQRKNTPETIFDIGSITKQFTAAAVLKLEMQNKLTTDDKLTDYFENIPDDKKEITIHDLLRHQSGLQSNVGGDYEKISQSDFINQVMNSTLKFDKGTGFSYSNIGYSLLAIIIEKVSGSTYEDYLYENLWKPAQMESTGYTRPDFDTSVIAAGYNWDDSIWGKPIDKAWDETAPFWHLKGNGGILSTTEDLYKWHQALMTENILSVDAITKLYHPELRPGENENPYYAYGWDVFKTVRNTLRIQHNGANGIFYADFIRFIDDKVTIIMMLNKAHPDFNKAGREISEIIFDKNYNPVIPTAHNEANRLFTDKIINTVLDKGLEQAKDEYLSRSEDLDIFEDVLNIKGYDLISENRIKEAAEVFEMNTFAFPGSWNAFDSLGESYMLMGNKDLAIKYYNKSLMLDPENMNAKEMLMKLEK